MATKPTIEEKTTAATKRLKAAFDAQLEQDHKHAKAMLDYAATTGFLLALYKEGGAHAWPAGLTQQAYALAYQIWNNQCERDERCALVFSACVRNGADLTKPLSEQIIGAWLDAPKRTGLNGLHVPMQMISDGALTFKEVYAKGWGTRSVRATEVSDRIEYRSANAEGAQAMFSTMLMPPVRQTLLATNHYRRKKKAYG